MGLCTSTAAHGASPSGGHPARVVPNDDVGKPGAKWTSGSEDSPHPLDAKQAPPSAASPSAAAASPHARAVKRDTAPNASSSSDSGGSDKQQKAPASYRHHWKRLLRKEGPDALAKSSRAQNINRELEQIEKDHRVTQTGDIVRLSGVAVAAIRRLRAAQATLAGKRGDSDEAGTHPVIPVLSHEDLSKLDPADLIARGFGIDDTTDALILQRITSAECTPTEIQSAFRATAAKKRTQEFHLVIAETLIQKGEPLLAEEVLYHCTKAFKENTKTRVRQLHGLALAQGGSTERAITVLEALQEEGAMDDEGGGLLARCYKDLAARERNAERRTALLNKAHAIYREAFESGGRSSYYTGINTATMALLTGRTVEAIALADDVVAICRTELKGELEKAISAKASAGTSERRPPSRTDSASRKLHDGAHPKWYRTTYSDSLITRLRPHFTPGLYWSLATVGEAHVIIGDFDTAAEYYTAARECAEDSWVRLASTQRQLRLLLKHKVESGLGPQALKALSLGEDAAVRAALSAARHGDMASSFTVSDADELGRAELGRFRAAAGSAMALHDAAEAEAVRKRVKAVLYDTRREIERVHQKRSRAATRARARRTSLPETFSQAKMKGGMMALELLKMSVDDKALRGGKKGTVGIGAAAKALRSRAARAKAKAAISAKRSAGALRQTNSSTVRRIAKAGSGVQHATIGRHASGKQRTRRQSDHDSETTLRRKTQEAALTSRSGPFACMMDIPTVSVFLSSEADSSVAMYAPGAEKAMRVQMKEALQACNARFVYCSPCSLADLVFLETAHELGCELYIILPIPLDVHLPWCAEMFMKIEAFGCAGGRGGSSSTASILDDTVRPPAASASAAAASAAAAASSSVPVVVGKGSGPASGKPSRAKSRGKRRNSLIFSTSGLIQRLRALLGVAARVDVANDMSPEMTVTNRHYCSLLVDGLARKRAQLLGTVTRRIYAHGQVMSSRDSADSWLQKRVAGGEYADINGMTPSGLHLLPQISCPWACDAFDQMLTSSGLFAGADDEDLEDMEEEEEELGMKQALMRDSSDAALPRAAGQVGIAGRAAHGHELVATVPATGTSGHAVASTRAYSPDQQLAQHAAGAARASGQSVEVVSGISTPAGAGAAAGAAAGLAPPPILAGSVSASPSAMSLSPDNTGLDSRVSMVSGLGNSLSPSESGSRARGSSNAGWQHAGQSRAATAVDPGVSEALWGHLEPPKSDSTGRRVSSSQATRLGVARSGGIMADVDAARLGLAHSAASSVSPSPVGSKGFSTKPGAIGPSLSVGGAGGLGSMIHAIGASSGAEGDLMLLGTGMEGGVGAGAGVGAGVGAGAAAALSASASVAVHPDAASSTWQHPHGLAEEQRRVARRTKGRRHSFAGLTPMEDEQLFTLRSEAQHTIAVAAERARAMAIANAVAAGAHAAGRLSSGALGASLPLNEVGAGVGGMRHDGAGDSASAAAASSGDTAARLTHTGIESNGGGIPRHDRSPNKASRGSPTLDHTDGVRRSHGSADAGAQRDSFGARPESKDDEDGISFGRGSSRQSGGDSIGREPLSPSRRGPGRISEGSEVEATDHTAPNLPIGFGMPRDRARQSIGTESIPESAGRPQRYSDAGHGVTVGDDGTIAVGGQYRSPSAARSLMAAEMQNDPRVALANLFAVPLAVEHWTVHSTPFRVIVSPFSVQASSLARLVTLMPKEAVAAAHTTAPVAARGAADSNGSTSAAEVSVARAMAGLSPQEVPEASSSIQDDPANLTPAEIEAAARAERIAKGLEQASDDDEEDEDEGEDEDEDEDEDAAASGAGAGAKEDASRQPAATDGTIVPSPAKPLGSGAASAAAPPTSKTVSFLSVVSKATIRSALDADLSRALEMLVPAFQQKQQKEDEEAAAAAMRQEAALARLAGEEAGGADADRSFVVRGSPEDLQAQAPSKPVFVRVPRQLNRRQVIAAPLFADVVNFSKLSEPQVLVFIENVLGSIANLIDSMPRQARPRIQQTWGDALYGVWSRVPAAGEFALMLSDLITKVPWHTLGLPNNLNIRISLHAAPVHVVTDPILRLKNYTGVHTSRAARIEPITPPGSVYCTQAFAAISEMLGVQSYECTYVGNVPLAKKYGMQPVFAVRWKSSSRSVPRTLHKRMRDKLKKLALKVRGSAKAKKAKPAAAAASGAAASKP